MKVKDYLCFIDKIAPFDTADDYDNVGLIVGDSMDKVNSVLLALDLTSQVIDEACNMGANLIITHHPVLFTPIKRVVKQDVQGALVMQLIKNGINHIAAHTNLDRAEKGVDFALMQALRLCFDSKSSNGYVWGGHYEKPIKSVDFIGLIKKELGIATLNVSGNIPDMISKVAVCSGAGGGELLVAHAMGYDVFITGELKYSLALEAQELGIFVVVAGHYQTERVVLPILLNHLQRFQNSVQCDIEIRISSTEESPDRYL